MDKKPTIYLMYANHSNPLYHTNICIRHKDSLQWFKMEKEELHDYSMIGPQSNEKHFIYVYKLNLSVLKKEIGFNSIKIKAFSNKNYSYEECYQTSLPANLGPIFLRFDLKFNLNNDNYYNRNPPDCPIQGLNSQILVFIRYFLEKEKQNLAEVLAQIDSKLSKNDSQTLVSCFEFLLNYDSVSTVALSLNNFKRILTLININAKEKMDKILNILNLIKRTLLSKEKDLIPIRPFLISSLNCLLTLLLVSSQIKFKDFKTIYNDCPIKNIEEYLLDENVQANVFFKKTIDFSNFKELFTKNLEPNKILQIFFSYNSNLAENLRILSANLKNLSEKNVDDLIKRIFSLLSKREIKLFVEAENQKEKTEEIFKYLKALKRNIEKEDIAIVLRKLLSEIEENAAFMIFNKEYVSFTLTPDDEFSIMQTLKEKYRKNVKNSFQKSFKSILKEDFTHNLMRSILDENFKKELTILLETELRKDKKLLTEECNSLVKLLLLKDLSMIRVSKGEIVKVIFSLLDSENIAIWFIKELLCNKLFPEDYYRTNIESALTLLMKLTKDISNQITPIMKTINSFNIDDKKINYNDLIINRLFDKYPAEVLFRNIGKYKSRDHALMNSVITLLDKYFTKLKAEKMMTYIKNLLGSESEEAFKKIELTENQLVVIKKLVDLSLNLLVEEGEIFAEGFSEKLQVLGNFENLTINNKELEKTEFFKRSLVTLRNLKDHLISENLSFKMCESLQRNCQKPIIFELKLKLLIFPFREDADALKKKILLISQKFQEFKKLLMSYNILLFSTNYFTRCSDNEELLKTFHMISENINDTMLKDFKFPPNLLQFKEQAEYLNKVDKSLVFHNIFFGKMKALGPKKPLIAELIQILEETKKDFEEKVKALCDPSKTNVRKLEELFRKNETEAQKELKLFEELFKLSANQQTQILNSLHQMENINNYVEIIESYQTLAELFELEKDDFWKKLAKGKELLIDQNLSLKQFMDKFPEIEEIINKKFMKSKEKQKNQQFLAIFKEMARNAGLIKFVQNKKQDDLRQLMENNENLEDELFKVESVISLIKVQKFVFELKNSLRKKNEEFFLNAFFELLNKNDSIYDKLDSDIYMASNNLSQITQRFNQQSMDKSEANKTKILRILDKSILSIIRPSKNDTYTCEIQIDGPIKERISYNDLIEMRDISLLYTQNSLSSSILERDKNFDVSQRFTFFKEIIDGLHKLIDLFQEIVVTGNPLFDEINLNITFRPKVKDDIDILIQKYSLLHEDWNQNLNSFYDESFFNCFFYGKHIETLYLESIGREKSRKQSHFICSYVQNMKFNIALEQEFDKCDPKSTVLKFLKDTAKILSAHRADLLNNYITYRFGNTISSGITYIYVTHTVNFCPYTFLLRAYFHFTNSLPIPQLVLTCGPSTTESEIGVFFSRCMKCPLNLLFSIARIDELDAKLQIYIAEKLMEFNSNQEKGKSAILIVNPKPAIAFMKQLPNLKVENLVFREDEIPDEQLKELMLNKVPFRILVVKSLFSGFGKSFYIQTEAAKNNSPLKYFPLSGTFHPNDVVNRLIELDLKPGESLHLDLGKFNEWVEVKEIIFSLIFYQGVFLSGCFYILPPKIDIYIELDNSEEAKYKEYLGFLSFFKEEVKRERIALDVSSEHHPSFENFNVVCKYLELLDQGKVNEVSVDFDTERTIKFSKERGRELLDKYFLMYKKDQNMLHFTNYQLISFISSLALGLKQFSYNFCLQVHYLHEAGIDLNIRRQVIENLILNASCFSMLNSSYLIELQSKNEDAIRQNNEEDEDKNLIKTHSFISFHKLQHLIICFDENSIELLSIQKDLEGLNANFRSFIKNLELLYSMNDTTQKALLKNYKDMKSEVLMGELKNFLGINPNVQIFMGDYVVTTDNFIKLVLIYLKAKSGIPVIMMGETGCGKTRLLKFLTQTLLDLDLKIINFHAGVDEAMIIERMNQINEDFKQTKMYNEQHKGQTPKKFWLFLDEINTCEHLGLISEIILKKSILGKKLEPELQIIAACNPYRVRSRTLNIIGLTAKSSSARKKTNERQLAYTVYPLPHSIMNFVFDFGSLGPEDIRKYIISMVDSIDNKKFKDLAVDMLCASHTFIIELEEASSVSLRDISRFMIFYSWFKKSIMSRKPPTKKSFFSYLLQWNNRYEVLISDDDATKNALILAIIMIYYVRLDSADNRMLYVEIICEQFRKNQSYLTPEKFIEIYDNEQMDYVSRMTINQGIALNTALKENLFILLVSICNNTPLIICGKPGCSKTLSVRLLYENMCGLDSTDDFFKALPRLYLVSYQGSLASSSQSIEKIFHRAYKINKSLIDKKEDGRVVVYFDELGLAELSKLNPLKVLHELLEPDKFDPSRKDKIVGFVGISNWRLDASKMNRAIFLARPDPNEKDLQKTAVEISQSYFGGKSVVYEDYFKDLAKTYFLYKKIIAEKVGFQDLQEFHGGRDFFHLIKDTCKKFIGMKRMLYHEDIYKEILEVCMEKNFGGIRLKNFNSQTMMKNCYKEVLLNSRKGYLQVEAKQEVSPLKLLEENLNDNDCRYFMLISKGNIGVNILDGVFKRKQRASLVVIGSKYPDDVNNEEYILRTISCITDAMEKGMLVIMQSLDQIYPSLYDLFNQNFTIIQNRKNCRIALGSTYNLFFVENFFKAFVLLDEKELANQETPFLNRFEKQIVNLSDVLIEKQRKVANDVLEAFNSIFKIVEQTLKSEPIFSQYIVNYCRNEIEAITFKYANENIPENITLADLVTFDLLTLASFDLILVFENSHNVVDKKKLIQIYLSQNHGSLSKFLKSRIQGELVLKHVHSLEESAIMEAKEENKENEENQIEFQEESNEKVTNIMKFTEKLTLKSQFSQKFIIYTFSHLYQRIQLDLFKDDEIEDFFIGEFKSEKELIKVLKGFLENPAKKLLMLSLKGLLENEVKHLAHLKFLIENKLLGYEREEMKEKPIKTVLIIIHLEKESLEKSNLDAMGYSKLSYEWESIMIDNLSPEFHMDLEVCLGSSLSQIIANRKMINLNELIIRRLPFVIKNIKYRDEVIFNEGNLFNYFHDLVDNLTKNVFFFEIIREKMLAKAQQNENWPETMISLHKNAKFRNQDVTTTFIDYISESLDNVLLNFFYNLETFSALDAFAIRLEDPKISPLLDKLMEIETKKIFDTEIKLLNATGANEIREKIWGIKFPFFMLYFNKLAPEIEILGQSLNELDRKIADASQEQNEDDLEFEKKTNLENERENLYAKTVKMIIDVVLSQDEETNSSIFAEFDSVSAILIEDLVNCYLQKHFHVRRNFEKTLNLIKKGVKFLLPVEKSENFSEVWLLLATKRKSIGILINVVEHLFLDDKLYTYIVENLDTLKRNEAEPAKNWITLINLIMKCYLPNLIISENLDFSGKYAQILESSFGDIYALFSELGLLFEGRNVFETIRDFIGMIYHSGFQIDEAAIISELARSQLEHEKKEDKEEDKEEDKDMVEEGEVGIRKIPESFDLFMNEHIQEMIFKNIEAIKGKYWNLKPTENPLREIYSFESTYLFAIFDENYGNPDEEQRGKSINFVLKKIFGSKVLLPFSSKTIQDILAGEISMIIAAESEDLNTIYEKFCEHSQILEAIDFEISSIKDNSEIMSFMNEIIMVQLKWSNGGKIHMANHFTKLAEQALDFVECNFNNNVEKFTETYGLMKLIHQNLALCFSIAFLKIFIQEILDIVMRPNSNDNYRYLGYIDDLRSLFKSNSEAAKLIQLYFLKEIKNDLGSIEKLKLFDFENKSLYFLVENFPALKPDINLAKEICGYECFDPKTLKHYKRVQQLFESTFISGIESSDKIMADFKANFKNGDFLLAFMDLLVNKCLVSQYSDSKSSKLLVQKTAEWLRANQKIFTDLMGENFYLTILSYCENRRNILDPADPKFLNDLSNQIQLLIFISRIQNIAFSLNDDPKTNPYYFIFGRTKEIDAINNSFIAGVGDGINSIQYKKKNEAYMNSFELYRNKQKNGIAHIYLCDCYYVYEVQPCGWFHSGMDPNGKCPMCGKSIGYKPPFVSIEKREGHFIVITPDEYEKAVKSYGEMVKETPHKFLQDMEKELKEDNLKISIKGYERVFEENFETLNYKIRGLNSIATRIFSLIINSIINGLAQSVKITDNELKILMTEKNNPNQFQNLEPLKYLWGIIRKEFIILKGLLPKNLEPQYLIVFNIFINSLREFLGKYPFCIDKVQRETLESQANAEIDKIIKNLDNSIRDYMLQSAEARNIKTTDIYAIIDELNSPNPKDYLFRFFRTGSSTELRKQIEAPNLPNSKFLKSFFLFQDELSLLKNSFPLVEFLNEALEYYRLKLERSKAKELKIKDFLTTKHRKEAFYKFQEAWEAFTSWKGFIWQLECHPLPQKPSFREDDDLAFLLVDKKELGFGMYSYILLNNIINLQNRILNELNKNQLRFYEESPMILQKANESQLFGVSAEDLLDIETNILRNSCSNLEYGKGGLICFNFQAINGFVHDMVFKGKKMLIENEDSIICMQYQYEMVPSTLLSRLRDCIPQKPFYEKDVIIHKFELQAVPEIPTFFQNVELLIYLIVNSNQVEIQSYKEKNLLNFIETLPKNFQINEPFINYCKRQEIQMKNLLAFFEIIELYVYYRQILEKVSVDYQEELIEDQKRDLEEFIAFLQSENNENRITLTRGNVADAIRRYICRNLIGSNLANTQKLGEFLGIDNLWPQSLLSETERVLELFPPSITFKFAVSAQKMMRTNEELELVEKKLDNMQRRKIEGKAPIAVGKPVNKARNPNRMR